MSDTGAWDLQRPVPRELIVGLDLGQSRDYTAIVVAERHAERESATYELVHIGRTRGELYPRIVEAVRQRIAELKVVGVHPRFPRDPRMQPRLSLVLDYTGPGRPVADMFAEADIGCPITMVTITGGDRVTRGEGGDYRVPKRNLAAVVQTLLHSGRLGIVKGEQLTSTLSDELNNFKVRISLSGHDSFGAGSDWRAGHNDDIVLAAALALWFGEYGQSDQWSDIAAEGLDLGAFFASR